jgi:plasmid maintenance system killer protein
MLISITNYMSTRKKKKFVNVTPISSSAKTRFEEKMNYFHGCEIEDERNNNLYLLSLNKQYRFIVNKQGDSDWKVEK